MALFSRKTKAKETTKKSSGKKQVVAPVKTVSRDLSSVLVKPRITEKAIAQGDKNVYTFVVRRDATKYDVRDAIKEFYGVTPVKINIVNKAPRQFMSRMKGRTISEKGMKKAYVYLKKGDSINLA